LSTDADIALFGGSAGGGKSFAILLDALRHIDNPQYNAVIFRRTSPQIKAPGGLWSQSVELYSLIPGAVPKESISEWKFPSGAVIKMSHMEHNKDRLSWQGTELVGLYFDEATHFEKEQIEYLWSRNRSMSGVKPFCRMSCNPDPDHFLRTDFVEWYLTDDGYADQEKSGIIRWFIRDGDDILWYESKEEAIMSHPDRLPKSFTFISSLLTDNQKLLDINPEYLDTLKSLPLVQRMQLLDGNWNIRAAAGLFFKRDYFDIVERVPEKGHVVRYWDRAATEGRGDYTVGLKLMKVEDTFYVLDVVRFQHSPSKVLEMMMDVAGKDGKSCMIMLEEDPGSAGKAEISYLKKALVGYNVRSNRVNKSKETRAMPVSASSEAGNIKLLRGKWNDEFVRELENYSGDLDEHVHDDQIDAFSGAFNTLLRGFYLPQKMQIGSITGKSRWGI
jgi:predicted phage terminase large subunit-like protein